ncbi:MAG: tetratricopeptide repeat protein [Cyanobacteria bacterium P01_D01_bin.2]
MAQLAEPSPEVQRVERLLQTADDLANASDAATDSVESVLSAYRQALAAYSSLDDPDTSLSIYEVLVDLNYFHCRGPQAISWAEQGLDFIKQLDESAENFGITQRLRGHGTLSQKLGDLYRFNEQPEAALQVYKDGLQYDANWPQSALGTPNYSQVERLLRSQLTLLPPDSLAAAETQQQLINTWQLAGAIEEVDGLMRTLDQLAEEDILAPERLLNQVLDTSRRYGYRSGELRALLLSSETAIAATDYDRAADHAQQAVALAEELRDGDRVENQALYNLAQATWGKGDLQAAIEQYEALLVKVQEPNQPWAYGRRVGELDIVPSLVALYRQTGQAAKAQGLINDYENRISRLRNRTQLFPLVQPFRPYPGEGSLPPYRICDEPETNDGPFLRPSFEVRRRGSGLGALIRNSPSRFGIPSSPMPTPLPSQPVTE